MINFSLNNFCKLQKLLWHCRRCDELQKKPGEVLSLAFTVSTGFVLQAFPASDTCFFFSIRCPNSTSGGCCEPLRAVEVVVKLCNLLVIWIKNSATVPFAELPVNASSTFFISALLYPRGRCWSEFWWCFFDTFLGFFPGTKAISDLSISLVPQRLRLLLCWMCWLQWNLRDRGWISPVVNLFQV